MIEQDDIPATRQDAIRRLPDKGLDDVWEAAYAPARCPALGLLAPDQAQRMNPAGALRGEGDNGILAGMALTGDKMVGLR